jgi:hypothetical protein
MFRINFFSAGFAIKIEAINRYLEDIKERKFINKERKTNLFK